MRTCPSRSARCYGSLFATFICFAAPASAVTIDWVYVGNPGNAADTPASSCYSASCGSVGYAYSISKNETTNAQYAEFLNAKAVSDPLGLYNTNMGSNTTWGGITRSGSVGSYTYAVKPGFANKPVSFVSFYDAARFANWLNNGQGSSSTETGAYTLLGGTATPSNPGVTRNALAITFVTSENEWYKAAYYSSSGVFFDYPTGTNSAIGCVAPGSDTGNSANCFPGSVPTNVGAYTLSDSPYGTFDQGGNLSEWNEAIPPFPAPTSRGLRGGDTNNFSIGLSAVFYTGQLASTEFERYGFRVASMIPEPGTALLLGAGLALLAARRRV